jgi:hypothetical protein
MTEWAPFVVSITALIGMAWAIYSGRHTLDATRASTAFTQAMSLLEERGKEIDRLNTRVGELERRDRWHEKRERKLMEALSQALRRPVQVLEAELSAPDEDDPDEPQPRERPNRSR